MNNNAQSGGCPTRAAAPQTAESGECPSRARRRKRRPAGTRRDFASHTRPRSPRHPRRPARLMRAQRACAALKVALFATLLCTLVLCSPAFADEPREVHGSGDAYAAPGVTLVWGILRGRDETSTQVVLRVVADPEVYASVAAAGKNPFSGQERVLQPSTPTKGGIDVRVPRAQYAEFPRTELRFYTRASPTAPALVVYYLGVPDTTPEFADASKLDEYLADRIARARTAAGAKAP